MATFSRSLRQGMLDWATVTGSPTRPAGFYLALYTVNPTSWAAGTGGTEATGGDYARKSMAMSAGSAAEPSSTANTAALKWEMGVDLDAATYTGWGIYSADSAGTFLGGDAFAADRVISTAGDFINFAIGSVVLNQA